MNVCSCSLSRPRVPRRLWLFCGLAVLLALGSAGARAAALGNAANSAGLFVAVAMLVLTIQQWPAHVPGGALPAVGAVLLVAGAAVWMWRARASQRLLGFAGAAVPVRVVAVPRSSIRTGPPASIVLPAGVDAEQLLTELRGHFVRLQAAWDLGEIQTLRALTMPEMLDEFCFECPGGAPAPASNRTDVVTLHAELLGFEELAGVHLVSIEFSGLIREMAEQGAHPFRELWMLAKSKQDGTGWRLARHQALL